MDNLCFRNDEKDVNEFVNTCKGECVYFLPFGWEKNKM